VASGTDQEELRRLFAARGWAPSFAGIFGSPTPKSALLWAIRDALPQVPPQRILMVGDALADHDAALAAGTSFVFVSRWAAQPGDIRERAATTGVPVARDLHHLHGALRATFGESAP
jgi:phosphoglycolate phosphatase-like HAD superfamily hydrolase